MTKRSKGPQKVTVDKKKASKKRKRPVGVERKGLAEALPTSVQKSYFLLKDAERNVLNIALEKYRPGQSEPIVVGDSKVFKPALRLMGLYRLVIQEITETGVTTSYTRWVDSVQAISTTGTEGAGEAKPAISTAGRHDGPLIRGKAAAARSTLFWWRC